MKLLYFLPFSTRPFFKFGITTISSLQSRIATHNRNFSIDLSKAIFVRANNTDVISSLERQLKAEYPYAVPEAYIDIREQTEVRPMELLFPMLKEIDDKRKNKPHLELKTSKSYSLMQEIHDNELGKFKQNRTKISRLRKQIIWEENRWDDELNNDYTVERFFNIMEHFSNRNVKVEYLNGETEINKFKHLSIQIEYAESENNYILKHNVPTIIWNTKEPIRNVRYLFRQLKGINQNIRIEKRNTTTGEIRKLNSLVDLTLSDRNSGLLFASPFTARIGTLILMDNRFISNDVNVTMNLEGLKNYSLLLPTLSKLKTSFNTLNCECVNLNKWCI